MRRLLRRKAVTISAAIIAFTAIPTAGIVATATPAQASVITLCNTYGRYCAGAPTISFGDPVVLTASGRQLDKVDMGFKCCGGYEVFRFEFYSDTTRCLGVPDSGTGVTVRECSGGDSTNVNWADILQPPPNGNREWFNTHKNEYLASDDGLGNPLFITPAPCQGCYLMWDD